MAGTEQESGKAGKAPGNDLPDHLAIPVFRIDETLSTCKG
jgi:hypothetical protein